MRDPWADFDDEYWHDADRSVRLRDLGGALPIPEWREMTWSGCHSCGEQLVGPCDANERLHDGEPMVCDDCGCVHSMSADSDGFHVSARTNMDDCWTYLRPTALAGLRRLLQAP